jgi:GNAT superfamily N-acetyltransferase
MITANGEARFAPPLLGGTITLRPMRPQDNAAAFILSELAFTVDGQTTHAEGIARQERWERFGCAWFSWLHTRADGNAWVAVNGDGPIVGYARAVRDPTQQWESLTELFVHPALHGRRIGQALLRAVLAPQVGAGWQRLIVADPGLAALALYLRWGTYPLGAAWYVSFPALFHPEKLLVEGQNGIRAARNQDAAVLATLERDLLGVARLDRVRFMVTQLGAQILVCEREGVVTGYGVRCGGEIGPVLGATSADTLALVQAHLRALVLAGETPRGLWVPCANIALLHWLRVASPQPVIVRGQVTVMASAPTLTHHLDRYVLTAPPYLW